MQVIEGFLEGEIGGSEVEGFESSGEKVVFLRSHVGMNIGQRVGL